MGIGAGAHSRVYFKEEKERSAIMMIHEPTAWLEKVKTCGAGIQNLEKISPHELTEELILMGLRLPQGISTQLFQQHFGKNISEIFDLRKLEKLRDQGLIEFDENNIKIKKNHRLLTNLIISKVCEAL